MPRRALESPCPQAADHTPDAPCTSEEAERLYRTHDQVRCEGCGRYEIWVPRPAGMLAPCFACGEPESVDVAQLGRDDPLECVDCRARREAAAEGPVAGVEPEAPVRIAEDGLRTPGTPSVDPSATEPAMGAPVRDGDGMPGRCGTRVPARVWYDPNTGRLQVTIETPTSTNRTPLKHVTVRWEWPGGSRTETRVHVPRSES